MRNKFIFLGMLTSFADTDLCSHEMEEVFIPIELEKDEDSCLSIFKVDGVVF